MTPPYKPVKHYFITAPSRPDLYWRPKKEGYTTDIAEAGLYNEADSASIVRMQRGDKRISLREKRQELIRLLEKLEHDIEAVKRMLQAEEKEI